MMASQITLHTAAFLKRIRHLPLVRSFDRFWVLMRKGYAFSIDPFSRGVQVTIREGIHARVPRDLFDFPLQTYEPENLDATFSYLKQNPNTCVLDVGAAIGIYAVSCLAASKKSRVIAFDSNLLSLTEADRICYYHGNGDRISRVFGFIGDKHETGLSLEAAEEATALAQKSKRHVLVKNVYINLPGENMKRQESTTPMQSLDGLLVDSPTMKSLASRGVKFLLKMDIEGAEMLALRGAARFLSTYRPTLAISIHPPFLPRFGTNREEIVSFVEALGYTSKWLAVDTEEHWWFEPTSR